MPNIKPVQREPHATTAGQGRIRTMLPHRYPMLLVDRILEWEPGARLTAVKAVTCNEPWYRDLPPGAGDEAYAYPQVLLIESWCQAAGALINWDHANPDVLSGKVMLFGGISDVRFHGSVLPGDVVEQHVRLVRALSDTAIFEGESIVGKAVVMEVARAVMATRPADALSGSGDHPAGPTVGHAS